MISKMLLRFLGRLRFPWLFAATAIIFGIDLVLPDALPFADELLLGLSTLLLASWKKRKATVAPHTESPHEQPQPASPRLSHKR